MKGKIKLNIDKLISKTSKEELKEITETLCKISSQLNLNQSLSKKIKFVRNTLSKNVETKRFILKSIKSALWDKSSLPMKVGLISFIGATAVAPGLNLGIATLGMGIGVSVSIAAGILGVFVGSIIQEIGNRLSNKKKVCLSCNSHILEWKGRPIKNKLHSVSVTSSEKCDDCNSSTTKLSRLSWKNVHNSNSTGLPDHWIIDPNGNDELNAKWGVPITHLYHCNKCGSHKNLISHSKEGQYLQCKCSKLKQAS